MARAGPAGAPAARWKGHIVRQLRQRDRTQKAFFLELVPACECVRALVDGRRGEGIRARGEAFSGPWGRGAGALAPRRLLASEAPVPGAANQPVTPTSDCPVQVTLDRAAYRSRCPP